MESGPAKLAKSAGEPEHEQFRRIEIADRYNNGSINFGVGGNQRLFLLSIKKET